MEKTVLEKCTVAILFVLVIVIFSFAERDTQKLFEKYNTKTTVQTVRQTLHYTADASEEAEKQTINP
jgi:hypothetical protein